VFLIGWCLLLPAAPARAKESLKVVATLSTFADLAKTIGGDDVHVDAVASPKFNPHFIEPRPSDVLKVKRADLFVHVGLDLEPWRGPLLDAAGNPNLFQGARGELDLSRGIPLLEVPDRPLSRLMGDIHIYGNPHYWLHPENAKIMAQAVAVKLSERDPAHADGYQNRLSDFLSRLDQKINQWRQEASSIRGREAIAYHNEWPYLAEFLGVKIEQFLEPKPGIPPGPKQIGFLEKYMKSHQIRVIVQPTFYPKGASEALARRTGARVVTLCQGVGELPEVSNYMALIEYNVRRLVEALKEES
jgi:ABC-type Zn uptake system ZnuABC Zn-binding protein ZnuA